MAERENGRERKKQEEGMGRAEVVREVAREVANSAWCEGNGGEETTMGGKSKGGNG
jgi:hypothetical protein